MKDVKFFMSLGLDEQAAQAAAAQVQNLENVQRDAKRCETIEKAILTRAYRLKGTNTIVLPKKSFTLAELKHALYVAEKHWSILREEEGRTFHS